MSNKTARMFRSLASKAFLPPHMGGIVAQSNFDEQVSFHKMHAYWLNSVDLNRGQEQMLRDRYPFLKVQGKWFVSVPKLYLYLFCARNLICKFEDKDMQAVYAGIQAASRYFDAAKELDKKLTPQPGTFQNWEEYTEKMSTLYENYLLVQRSIFDGLEVGTEKTPVV